MLSFVLNHISLDGSRFSCSISCPRTTRPFAEKYKRLVLKGLSEQEIADINNIHDLQIVTDTIQQSMNTTFKSALSTGCVITHRLGIRNSRARIIKTEFPSKSLRKVLFSLRGRTSIMSLFNILTANFVEMPDQFAQERACRKEAEILNAKHGILKLLFEMRKSWN